MVAPDLVLLGPQRLQPIVRQTIRELGLPGERVAIVTAGWEEREGEDQELRAHLATDTVNLRLHERIEAVFRERPDVFRAMEQRFDRLRAMRDVYRRRLDHALEAARELLRLPDADPFLEEERAAAIHAVHELDEHHLERTRVFQRAFEAEHRVDEIPELCRERDEVDALLEGATALCIAGGHVGMLLNRLRLFGIARWFGRLPVLAWSAGAMALSDRIVLFHDSPPQGRVNAEVLEAGLGACNDVVPLPHAKRRLLLDDPVRVGLFARRFPGKLCAALDEGSRLDRTEAGWQGAPGTRRLDASGSLEEVGRWS